MGQQAQIEMTVDDDRPLSQRVVEAVADATGSSLLDLHPPLHHAVDLEALDDLLQPGTRSHVEFSYDGHRVVVHSDGEIRVSD